MPRGLKAWRGQLIDPESGNRFAPGTPGFNTLMQLFPEEAAQVLSGNSTPRMAGEVFTKPAKESAEITQPIDQMPTLQSFDNNIVRGSEHAAIQMMRPELEARLINVRDNKTGIDATTNRGNIDIQFVGRGSNISKPAIDFISHGHLSGHPQSLAPYDDARNLHSIINNDIRRGARLEDVLGRLEEQGFVMGGPQSTGYGKLLNSDNYPAVAFLRRDGRNFTDPRVIDMAALKIAAENEPLRDLGLKMFFNNKRNYAPSASDTWESAILLPQNESTLDRFDVTDIFF